MLTIVALFITVKYGIPALQSRRLEKKNERIKTEELFKTKGWIKASHLTYDDLDYNRKMQSDLGVFYQKKAKEKIKSIIDKRKEKEFGNHILLVGPSLSGKTHITISILHTLKNAYVLVPNEATYHRASADGFYFPDIPKDAQYKIILLDNFHEFFKSGDINPKPLIHKAIEKGFTLWGNCISIDEYDRVISILDFKENVLGPFKKIELSDKLTKKEVGILNNTHNNNKRPSTFNGLIGEYYYPPNDMIQHYTDIKSKTVSKDVLIFIKQAYMLGEFNIPYTMQIDTVKKPFFKKYGKNSDFTTLYDGLKFIEKKGFIKLLNNHETFTFDSVWLSEIVEREMRIDTFYEFWKDLIPKNVILYSYLIHNSENYTNSVSLFNEMISENITPNKLTYNILMNHSPNYLTAVKWFEKIPDNEADIYTYNTLIKHSPTYETALQWFTKIRKTEASVITYSTLINVSPNYNIALEWFEKIPDNEATVITYNTLINLSPDYDTALEWFEKIDENEATVVTYNTLIKLSPDYDTALEWFEKIDEEKATKYSYNCIISKSKNIDTLSNILKRMKSTSTKINMDAYTYGAIFKAVFGFLDLSSIEKYQYVTFLHDEMLENKIKSNVHLFTMLISLSPDFDVAFEILNSMPYNKDQKGFMIMPNERTKNVILKKTLGQKKLINKVNNWFTNNDYNSNFR